MQGCPSSAVDNESLLTASNPAGVNTRDLQ